ASRPTPWCSSRPRAGCASSGSSRTSRRGRAPPA
ncbi:MAG: UDP-N-acetylmuramoyl-tripeptide--D-alanyl-D-alanine ligase, partial [uncultured Gemmatimonadaceae bacterium]